MFIFYRKNSVKISSPLAYEVYQFWMNSEMDKSRVCIVRLKRYDLGNTTFEFIRMFRKIDFRVYVRYISDVRC